MHAGTPFGIVVLHATPHPPQFAVSDCQSTQWSTHLLGGLRQTKSQWPEAHLGSAPGGDEHCVVQSPQWFGSACTFVHAPAQFTSSDEHVDLHCWFEQT